MVKANVRFRFHGSLNDFLVDSAKSAWITYAFKGKPAVKDAIEAIGVPHPEIQVITANVTPVSFTYQLQPEDQIEVYPICSSHNFHETFLLIPPFPETPTFVLDVHLGKLAKMLRMLGFDTLYQNNFDDKNIANLAATQNRIVLTRDVGLLKQKQIIWGYWLRSQFPETQLKEVITQFKLAGKFQPFTRCLECNGKMAGVGKEKVLDVLPAKTRLYFEEFYQCAFFQKVYWKGSHYDHMQQFIKQFQ